MITDSPTGHGNGRQPLDLVERLIPLADDGPEIPVDGAEKVRAATRGLWRRQVKLRRTRRRLAWTGIGLAAAATVAVAVGLARWRPAAEPPAVATVAVVDGILEVRSPDGGRREVTAAGLGSPVEAGDRLLTGVGSRAALRLAGGQSLRLDGSTDLRLGRALTVDLDRGAVYVDSGVDDVGTVEVSTPLGVARDVGTQFEVRVDDGELTVRVREGVVALTRGEAVLQIASGTGVTVPREGEPLGFVVSSAGDEWQWVQGVAPDFDIEGRTALALLDWVSRETGLWVSFATPEAERIAATSILHGRLEKTRPERAADLVLASCGLEAVRVDGRLLVSQSPAPD